MSTLLPLFVDVALLFLPLDLSAAFVALFAYDSVISIYFLECVAFLNFVPLHDCLTLHVI